MAYALYNHPNDNVISLATPSIRTGSLSPESLLSFIGDFSDEVMGFPLLLSETSGAILLDFGAPQRADIVVLWTNFKSGLAGVKWQMNATNSWGAPTVNSDVVIPDKREDGYTIKPFVDLRAVAGYSTGGFRYMSLFVDPAFPNDVPIGVKVWLGQIVRQLDRPIERNQHLADHHSSISLSTDSAYKWTYDLLAAPRTINGKVNAKLSTDAAIRSFYRACRGVTLPALVIPNPLINDAWIVRWTAAPGPTMSSTTGIETGTLDVQLDTPSTHPLQVGFQEVVAGAPEWQ